MLLLILPRPFPKPPLCQPCTTVMRTIIECREAENMNLMNSRQSLTECSATSEFFNLISLYDACQLSAAPHLLILTCTHKHTYREARGLMKSYCNFLPRNHESLHPCSHGDAHNAIVFDFRRCSGEKAAMLSACVLTSWAWK